MKLTGQTSKEETQVNQSQVKLMWSNSSSEEGNQKDTGSKARETHKFQNKTWNKELNLINTSFVSYCQN